VADRQLGKRRLEELGSVDVGEVDHRVEINDQRNEFPVLWIIGCGAECDSDLLELGASPFLRESGIEASIPLI
jgi:hypothetical protein